MSVTMEDSIKRWKANRKAALVIEIIQGKTKARLGQEGNTSGREAPHHPIGGEPPPAIWQHPEIPS